MRCCEVIVKRSDNFFPDLRGFVDMASEGTQAMKEKIAGVFCRSVPISEAIEQARLPQETQKQDMYEEFQKAFLVNNFDRIESLLPDADDGSCLYALDSAAEMLNMDNLEDRTAMTEIFHLILDTDFHLGDDFRSDVYKKVALWGCLEKLFLLKDKNLKNIAFNKLFEKGLDVEISPPYFIRGDRFSTSLLLRVVRMNDLELLKLYLDHSTAEISEKDFLNPMLEAMDRGILKVSDDIIALIKNRVETQKSLKRTFPSLRLFCPASKG